MIKWLKILLFAAIVGFAKGHHFIRLVILAGLGLAGLWMVHTLAQDFNTIQTNTLNNINNNNNDDQNNNNNGGGYQTSLFKRSIPEATNHHSQINWEVVLSRDPASCARSFLCQLAASEEKTLSKEEKIILNLVSNSANEDNWASKQLQISLKNGAKATNPTQCMKIYKFCPYSSHMMTTLLKFFGR